MYDFLRGAVANLDTSGRVSLDVNGVGYSVRVSDMCRRRLRLDGQAVTVWVRLVVREDDLILFGFHDVAERAAFDQLTAIQGVGPSVAMALLSHFTVPELLGALRAKDRKALAQAKGVGAKLAERLTVEMADRLDRIPATAETPAGGLQVATDVQVALVALGFGSKEAAEAVAAEAHPGIAADALLRAALARLR